MKKIVVTGGSGGAGHYVIKDLLSQGYECVNLDVKTPVEALCPFVELDMNDYRAVHRALSGADGLVHFAGNPHPDDEHFGASDRFSNNTNALFNAFNAARENGIKRIVWASSETIFGFPFENCRPSEVPLTETAPRQPQNGYALSKTISEDLAVEMSKLYDMTIIGLRLSNVLYDDVEAVPSFQKIPGYWKDLEHRKFNLWGYIDARDAARAVRLALEADLEGAEVFNIAASNTLMKQPSRDLIQAVFPGVPVRAGLASHGAMLCCDKARRLLGWQPDVTWQDVLGGEGKTTS